jgi:hypothetical protein
MGRRFSVPVLSFAIIVSLCLCSPVFGQAKPEQAAAASPVKPTKWMPPLKGEGTIEVIRGKPRHVGQDMVSVLKIKNTSKAPLALVTVEEYWYNAKRETVSGDTQRHKALLQPGEIVEITTKSPYRADMSVNLFMFRHANGKLTAKAVTKFQE